MWCKIDRHSGLALLMYKCSGVDLCEYCDTLGIPTEFEDAGNEEILSYLREMHTSKPVTIKRVKVMLLGRGGHGKTTLIKRLLCHDELEILAKQIHQSPHDIQLRDQYDKLIKAKVGGSQTTNGVIINETLVSGVEFCIYDFGKCCLAELIQLCI